MSHLPFATQAGRVLLPLPIIVQLFANVQQLIMLSNELLAKLGVRPFFWVSTLHIMFFFGVASHLGMCKDGLAIARVIGCNETRFACTGRAKRRNSRADIHGNGAISQAIQYIRPGV
jgi:hypothetical protein